MSSLLDFRPQYAIDKIYFLRMSMAFDDEPVSFEIDLVDGEKTYIFITTVGNYYSQIFTKNNDYFLSALMTLPDFEALHSNQGFDDEITDSYSYSELEKYLGRDREEPPFWEYKDTI
jgi:hypothetical protein